MPVCPNCSMVFDEGEERCPFCGEPVRSSWTSQASTSKQGLVGQTLPGGYVVKERIATGGMAAVYRAEQLVLGRNVAVKVMHEHLMSDETAAHRFMNEARAASRLNHPHTLSVIDFGRLRDGRPYLIMEFLRGKDLNKLVEESGPLSFRRTVDILMQLLDALSEAHGQGIVHRDLKPENIIIESLRSGEDFVKVVDFGLAKVLTDAGNTSVTGTGTVCGTPDFMSPEQCQAKPLDGRSDLYAVGVILFFMMTGQVPFPDGTPMQTLVAHVTKAPPDPRTVVPDRRIPDTLAKACLRALEKDPDRRFQSAEEFSLALEETRNELLTATAPISINPIQRVRCPVCGGWSLAGSKFCGECGAPFTRTDQALRTIPPKSSSVSPNSARNMKAISGLPLVGRSEAVLGLLDTLAGGTQRNILIVGASGVGKRSVLRAFGDLAQRRGYLVLRIAPDRWNKFVPLEPLRQFAQETLEAHGLTNQQQSNEHLRWLLASHEGQTPGLSKVDDVAKALVHLLQLVAAKHPEKELVLVAENLDRYDTVTQAVLGVVATRRSEPPVLTIGTASSAEATVWPEQIPTVELPPLDSQDVKRLLLFAGVPENMIPTFERPVTPLYAEQAAAALIDGLQALPPSFGDLMAARLARLDLPQRRLVQYLAVLPTEFPVDQLRSLISTHEEGALSSGANKLEDLLHGLQRARLVRVNDGKVCLVHPLLQDVILGTTPVEVMRTVFRTVESFFGKHYQLPVEIRAHFAVWSEDSFQALVLLDEAASYAFKRGDMAGTIRLLQDAVNFARSELSRGMLDDPMQAVVLFGRKLGEVLLRVHRLNDAEGVLEEARGFASQHHRETVRVLKALGDVWRHRNRADKARQFYQEGLEVARSLGDDRLVLRLEKRLRLLDVLPSSPQGN